MVLLFRKMDLVSQTRDEASQVLVLRPRGKALSYAFGALWSGQKGGVRTREELQAFLKAEVERRTLSPRIRLKTAASRSVRELSPIQISTRLAESEMKRRGESLSHGGWDALTSRPSSWNYTTGLLMQAMDDLSAAAGDRRFSDYARRTIDSYLTKDGAILGYEAGEFNIDHINSGKMLQRLQARHPDPKYRAAIGALAAQLAKHPRTSEGAFWHKQRYPHQLWLDGVYMGMPFLAGAGVAEGDDHKVEEAVREFTIARSHLRDPRSGLYYHAWDEAKKQSWADPETGRSRFFWGRGLGWYAMALVDILDVIPPREDRAARAAPRDHSGAGREPGPAPGRDRRLVPDPGPARRTRELPGSLGFGDVHLLPGQGHQQGLSTRIVRSRPRGKPTPAWSTNSSPSTPTGRST